MSENGSQILFNDFIGRSYSIEFTNFPCKIHYIYRASWFSPMRTFLVMPAVMDDDEGDGDDSKQWVTKEVKGSTLDESDYFTDGDGVTFVIRPQSGGTNEDE
jgi:hypothetical protein